MSADRRRHGRSPQLLVLVVLTMAGLFGLQGPSAASATTAAAARTFTYDGAAIARVGVDAIDGTNPGPAQLNEVRERSAWQSVVSRGISTTSPLTFIATNNGVDLSLKYKPGWSAEQIAAADGKVASLNQAAQNGELVLTPVQRSGTSAASRYRSSGGSVPPGADVDHVIDLQLGGLDDVANMSPLNASVNRSLGAQIGCQLSGMPAGTVTRSVSIC